MSEKTYVEKLAERVCVYMTNNDLVIVGCRNKVLVMPLAVQLLTIRDHARSLADLDLLEKVNQPREHLGASDQILRHMQRQGLMSPVCFCQGNDAHGRSGRDKWSMIATSVYYHLLQDPRYNELRALDRSRVSNTAKILAGYEHQYELP